MLRVCLLAISALLAYERAYGDPVQGRDCREFHKIREEYNRAIDCPYGKHNWTLNGCIRYKCREDPCLRVNCSSSEHCERVERVQPNSQGDRYSASCFPGPDCKPLQKECSRLQHCDFGIEKINGTDGCERCKCKQNPCKTIPCAEGKRCMLQKSIPLNDQEPTLFAKCITMEKSGACPVEDTSPHNDTCPRECVDDADCQGVGKCCQRGCSHLCLAPVTLLENKESSTSNVITKSIKISEDSTTNEEIGPEIIGTTTLDPYSSFQFGCCADNETGASGPYGLGCPCNATEYSGSPEGVSREPECKTPSSLAPCGNNVTVFYYDSERGQCLVSGFRGCGHRNTYNTEEECERSCGAFRGTDVCGARPDPGPCRASIPKIYWDAILGSCQPFVYGGCAGGPNRFSSVEECMNVCGDTGLDSDEVLPTDCTLYQQKCDALYCQFGVDWFAKDGCQRCICIEDPCITANCASNERCKAVVIRDFDSQGPVYYATYVTGILTPQ